MTDTLTVLKTTERGVATKRLTRLPKGGWEKEDFLAGTLFMCHVFPVDGIESFHVLIVVISGFQNCFVIRGSPRGHVDLTKPVYRRKDKKWGDTAHFEECPRLLLMIDIDKLVLGDHLDLFGDPEAAVEEAIRKVLPEQYHDVSFVWQLSSSAGTIDPPGTLSAHVWFWLDRPIGEAELKLWHRLRAPLIDPSVFGTVQPLYTAGPIFSNCSDPLPKRIGLATRKRDEASLPKIDSVSLNKFTAGGGCNKHCWKRQGF